MFAAVLLTRFALPWVGVEEPWHILGTTILVGVTVYPLLLLRSRSGALRDVLGLLEFDGASWLRRAAGRLGD